ncbi:MAG TPA: hypothetical protein VIL36_17505 [Acidimicrobiales bacterium]
MTSLRTGYVLGVVAMFLLVLAFEAALGLMGWPAVLVALFVALFAGGGLGVLVAGRLQHAGAGRRLGRP